MGGIQTDVTQPAPDHIHLRSRFQEVDRGGMTEDVGADGKADRFAPGVAEAGGVTTNDLVDSESRQRTSRVRCEDGRISSWRRRAAIKDAVQFLGCCCPQGAGTPPIALSVELNSRMGTEIKVGDTDVCRLLNTSASVVQEQQ